MKVYLEDWHRIAARVTAVVHDGAVAEYVMDHFGEDYFLPVLPAFASADKELVDKLVREFGQYEDSTGEWTGGGWSFAHMRRGSL